MTIIKEKLGIIAAHGTLPLIFIKEATLNNKLVVAIALANDVEKEIKKQGLSEKVYRINLGQINTIIKTLLKEEIKRVVLLGKVNKADVFTGLKFDARIQSLIKKMVSYRDTSFMELSIQELESEGLTVMDQTEYLSSLLVSPSVLTFSKPDNEEIADINYGLQIAREMARMDIGQTVVVRNCTVIAVEALEGTDVTIHRAGKLTHGGGVVAKVSRPNQDLRFDIPAVGINTLKIMKKAGIRVLALEAFKTLLVDKDEIIEFADRNNMCIIAEEFPH